MQKRRIIEPFLRYDWMLYEVVRVHLHLFMISVVALLSVRQLKDELCFACMASEKGQSRERRIYGNQ